MGITKRLLARMVKELQLPLLHANEGEMRSYPFFEDRWIRIATPDASGTTHIWLSEDWDFCEKARQIGVRSYIDTSVVLGHQGTTIRTMADVEAYQSLVKSKKAEADQSQQEPRDYVALSSVGATG